MTLPQLKRNLTSGFTLIELLVVTSIIAALAIVVFAALNPPQRIRDANDARRRTDVDSLLISIHQYIVDNDGALPTGMSTSMAEQQLGTGLSACEISDGGCDTNLGACIDLSAPLAPYLKTIPVDPVFGTTSSTYYTVAVDSNNIVTVRACGAEASSEIYSAR